MQDKVVNKELRVFQNKEDAFAKKKSLLGVIKTLIILQVILFLVLNFKLSF
jgi:hypothetical protein